MVNNELQHWGIKGMRWGIRRFQNKDGSLTKAGKNRYSGDDAKTETKPETKEEYEARKQQAIKSGSAKDVLQFKGDLTKQEMQTAIERIRWERDMESLSPKEVDAGKAKADRFFSKMDDVTGYAVTASKAWNTFANVYNAFSGTDKVSLPTIATDNTKSNKAVRKKEKKDRNDAEEAENKKQQETKETAGSKTSGSADSKSDTVTGKVVGGGKTKTSDTGKSSNKSEPIDAEWWEVADSTPSSSTKSTVSRILNSDNLLSDNNVSAGRSRIAGLLEAPKKDDD